MTKIFESSEKSGFLSPDGKSIVFGKPFKSSFEYWLIENFLPK